MISPRTKTMIKNHRLTIREMDKTMKELPGTWYAQLAQFIKKESERHLKKKLRVK